MTACLKFEVILFLQKPLSNLFFFFRSVIVILKDRDIYFVNVHVYKGTGYVVKR